MSDSLINTHYRDCLVIFEGRDIVTYRAFSVKHNEQVFVRHINFTRLEEDLPNLSLDLFMQSRNYATRAYLPTR